MLSSSQISKCRGTDLVRSAKQPKRPPQVQADRSSDDRRAKKPGACFKCGEQNYYKRVCVNDEKKSYMLAVADGIDAAQQWILNSGSVRHLVMTASQLDDIKELDEECPFATGESLRMQLKSKTCFAESVGVNKRPIELIDSYFSATLSKNIFFMEK